MSDISERMLSLIEKKKISYGDLSNMTKIPKSTLQRYATGDTPKIPLDRLKVISNALGVSDGYLLGWETNKLPENITLYQDVPMIPEVGNIAAGVPILAEENIIGYLPAEGIKNPEEYFYLRVKGDSMINANIPDGSSVLIHKQNCAENGQIVACLVNGDSATLKRFKQMGDTVFLMPENTKYEPIIVKCGDFDTGYARILGAAVRCITITNL